MTARSVSWADAREVASLLSRVSAPKPRAPRPMVPAMGRPAAPAPRPAAPAPVKREAPPPAAPPSRALPVEPPKIVLTSDNPADRLDALLAWTLDHFHASGAFVADDNGLTLAAHGISEAHVSIVGPLLSALAGARSIPGIDATAGALWLGAQMMSWVEVRGERGGFCLGTVGSEALPTRSLDHLRAALTETVRGL